MLLKGVSAVSSCAVVFNIKNVMGFSKELIKVVKRLLVLDLCRHSGSSKLCNISGFGVTREITALTHSLLFRN